MTDQLATSSAMYRVLGCGLACTVTLAATMPAGTTSFVTLADINSTDTPSIVTVGEASSSPLEARGPDGAPATGQNVDERRLLVLSGSILATGPDAIPVASEQVSSVEDEAERPKPRWISQALPTIIRGGTQGSAARNTPASVPAAAPEQPAADAPAVSPR